MKRKTVWMKYRISKLFLLFLLLPIISFKGNCLGVSKQFLEEKNSFEFKIKHDTSSPIDIQKNQNSVSGNGVSLQKIQKLNGEKPGNESPNPLLFSYTKNIGQLIVRYSPLFLLCRVLRL